MWPPAPSVSVGRLEARCAAHARDAALTRRSNRTAPPAAEMTLRLGRAGGRIAAWASGVDGGGSSLSLCFLVFFRFLLFSSLSYCEIESFSSLRAICFALYLPVLCANCSDSFVISSFAS